MSLESQLKRCADALEKLVDFMSQPVDEAVSDAECGPEGCIIDPGPGDAVEPEEQKEEPHVKVTYAELAAAATALAAAKGKEAPQKVLDKFGVKGPKELKEDDYPAVLAALTKAAV